MARADAAAVRAAAGLLMQAGSARCRSRSCLRANPKRTRPSRELLDKPSARSTAAAAALFGSIWCQGTPEGDDEDLPRRRGESIMTAF